MSDAPVRFAPLLALPFGLYALVSTFWGIAPRSPSEPFEVRVVGPGEVPLAATVVARCWPGPSAPIEVSGSTDARGVFRVEASGCQIVELAATAPGHLPATERVGPPDGALTLSLALAPPASEVEIRAEGWAGRDRPGARLALERSAGGELRVLGWDLLGDQPAADREGADLWLERSARRPDNDPRGWVLAVGPTGAVAPRLGALPRRPWLAPTPPDLPGPALWHAWQLDQDWADGKPADSNPSYWLCARDGHTTALLLQEGDPRRSEGCLDGQPGCETWTWTFAVLLDASGAGRFAHGLAPRTEALLGSPDATQDRGISIAALLLPEVD